MHTHTVHNQATQLKPAFTPRTQAPVSFQPPETCANYVNRHPMRSATARFESTPVRLLESSLRGALSAHAFAPQPPIPTTHTRTLFLARRGGG